MARRSAHFFFFLNGYDNYIPVHNVTLCKTFSQGHKKEIEPQKCALKVPSLMSYSSRTVGEGTEGKSWLLLAFLMSRRRPFSSTKINIWALVVPLCLITGHPGLHTQEFIDPENFQSNSRPEQLWPPSQQLVLTQMFKWDWNYLKINCIPTVQHLSVSPVESLQLFWTAFCFHAVLFVKMLLTAFFWGGMTILSFICTSSAHIPNAHVYSSNNNNKH